MTTKDFDCVRMKCEIQQRIAGELEGLSPEEQRRKTDEIISGDPMLARLWSRAHPIGAMRQRP